MKPAMWLCAALVMTVACSKDKAASPSEPGGATAVTAAPAPPAPARQAPNLSVSEIIERPAAVVFQFVGVEHIQNHPRWDPKMQLEQLTEGPIRVGTRVRRHHTHSGKPTEGEMECEELVPDRAIGFVIHDGPGAMHGRMAIEPLGAGRSRLTISVVIPGLARQLDPTPVAESLGRIKQLIESER